MISIQNLGKQFSGRWIFRGLNLEVRPQESIVIMGPSGQGKSVFLKTIAGLFVPDKGQITLKSKNIGMLFQKNALFDSLTVEENLLFPLKERQGLIGAKARAKAQLFLQAVGLAGSEKQYPDEISGGMQKRLGIARALIVEPEILLYDEPTAGLDPITSRMIAELIKKLGAERATTSITVTNDVRRAFQLGDRVFLLAQGQLLGGGTPDEMKNEKSEAIKQFISGSRQGPLTAVLA